MVSPCFFFMFIKSLKWELEKWLSRKSSGCSGRGPGFSPQHSDGGSQSSGSPLPRHLMSSSGLRRRHKVSTQYTYLHIGKMRRQKKKNPKPTIASASDARPHFCLLLNSAHTHARYCFRLSVASEFHFCIFFLATSGSLITAQGSNIFNLFKAVKTKNCVLQKLAKKSVLKEFSNITTLSDL